MAKSSFEYVLAHWGTLIEGFQTSSLEFYASVESALQKRDVPEINLSRVNYKESGVLSAKREYLRVSRRHLLFDICALRSGQGCSSPGGRSCHCFLPAWSSSHSRTRVGSHGLDSLDQSLVGRRG
jgi:hypothetical protein